MTSESRHSQAPRQQSPGGHTTTPAWGVLVPTPCPGQHSGDCGRAVASPAAQHELDFILGCSGKSFRGHRHTIWAVKAAVFSHFGAGGAAKAQLRKLNWAALGISNAITSLPPSKNSELLGGGFACMGISAASAEFSSPLGP